ncbi:MAG: tetratricopeptide repeat protein [Xenococcaceae cyanobacterium MO_188.B19]|nr:tetratricopeptide repeat protein [Xenococcaceae cyanobacterium MO_188.B19]
MNYFAIAGYRINTLARGIILDDLGYTQRALLDYEKVLDLNPKIFQRVNSSKSEGYHERGIILARLAEKLVHRAEKEAIPKETTLASYFCDASIEASVERTRAYREAKNLYDEAIKDYRQAIRYNTNLEDVKYAKAFRDRGYIYSRLGDSQEALEDFEQAIYIKKTYAPAYFARGCVRADNGDYEDAIQDFTKAISYGKGEDQERLVAITQDSNPDFDRAEAYFHRGLVHAKLDQYKKAVDDYSKALKKYRLPRIKAAKYHYARANAFYEQRI